MTCTIDLSEVIHARAELPRRIGVACGQSLLSGLRAGERVAEGNAPFKTYYLRNQIEGRVLDVSADGARGELLAGAPYSSFQNDGTRYIAAKRFMEAGATACEVELHQDLQERAAAVCASL